MSETKEPARKAKTKASGNANEVRPARNWKQLSKKEIQKLHPKEKSRYLAYEEPSKHVLHGINASRKRIADVKKDMKRLYAPLPSQQVLEAQRHEQLIGQLKAAEARNRGRLLRLRYEKSRAEEVNHLISCQPTAIKAMRLQTLLPAFPKMTQVRDILGKDERMRVENLLADEIGLETGRILRSFKNHFHKLTGSSKMIRILFPLCGKSMDMKWAADQGHMVVGVEGSELAVKEFFTDHGIECKMDAINMAPRGALIFSSLDETIKLFVCDMFSFRSSVAGGQFDGVFDRGALVAINPKDRISYGDLMADLVAPGGKILLECFEYDPSVHGGPPHNISEDLIHEIYGKHFKVEQLEKIIDESEHLKKQFNIDVMHRCIYLLSRK